MSEKNTQKMGVGAIARSVGRARQTVLLAISEGRLPAESIPIGGGRRVYAIDPADADALWPKKIPVSA